MISVRPLQCDGGTLAHYTRLFSRCFPRARGFSAAYLDWLYRQNPDGEAIGFDAWDGDQLAAHYACVPSPAALTGRAVKGLVSLNTATDPKYQGQGLFTRLAQLTYQAAAEAGVDCVVGVANASSTEGFVRKLGFQQVQALDVRVGIGSLEIDWTQAASRLQFSRNWTDEALAWRCASPRNTVFARQHQDLAQFHAVAQGMVLPVYAELPMRHLPRPAEPQKTRLSPLRLFIGLVPEGACQFRRYASIPHRLRPSPLNFIYRSLTGSQQLLEPGTVGFSFLDFDAY